jgi:hypothetical protein
MTQILQGQVLALFAFDLGYEISLEKLSSTMATTPIQPLSRKKQTPAYLQYTRPPQILHLGFATGHFSVPGTIQATIFDFGAVSISYESRRFDGAIPVDACAYPAFRNCGSQ